MALGAALFVSSCLTPTIDFGDGPPVTGGTSSSGGGAPSDGGSDPGGTGGMNVGGEGGMVVPPVPHCTNRELDSDETDRDCGGLDCAPCANGKKCDVASDCKIQSCVSGRCQAASCTDKVKNGKETDVDCGGTECGTCDDGDSCIKPSDCESKVCKSGTCREATCGDKVKNGNETDVDCGGGGCDPCDVGQACKSTDDCEQPPNPEEIVSCDDQVCTIACGPFVDDCNQKAADGCETNLLTSQAHCGACRAACAPANARGECVAGNCLIDTDAPDTNEGCLGSFANCNGETDDGCEADLMNDAETCGGCDTKCSSHNGTPDCDAGACFIDCDSGFDDCNQDVSDGCEADLAVSTLHCAECNNVCSAIPPEVPVCDGTQCVGVTCDGPSACGGEQPCGACDPDTTCNDLLNTTTHCGGCGVACTAANATTACVQDGAYACIIGSCSGAYANCDDIYLNGCEIDTSSNRNRCGGCLATDENAGAGVDCDLTKGSQVAQTSCSGGACKVLACNNGYADCNGVWSDGCEANLNTSETHCGGCTSGPTTTWDGGTTCEAKPNATNDCSGGQCNYVCLAGWSNADGDWADGCETRTITLVNSSDASNTGTYFKGITGSATLQFSHTLETTAGNHRLVLLAYLCRGNNTTECTPTVTYGSTSMVQLGSTVGGSTQHAGMFYLLDSALPAPGTRTVTLDPPADTGFAVQILELAGVEQNTFQAALGNNANMNSCSNSPGNDVSVTLNSLPAGSRIYAVAGGYSNSSVTISPQAPLSLLNGSGTVVSGVQLGFAGGWTNSTVSGTQSAPFQLSGCDRSLMLAVAIRPEANY